MATWMIVEDEAEIYEVMVAMFDLWNVKHIHFFNGQDAVEWIDAVDAGRSSGELPELAILDIRLPGDISGPDVGARLRKSNKLGKIGIVMITAYRLKQTEEDEIIATAGADKFLYKPLPGVMELHALFDEVIKKRRSKS
ncbi:MAG: response regulator [Anaerolineae bacterium]|nr:response regulator [Anaerolineae bacterium]